MDQQVDADWQNAHVLQYVNEYKWTISFNIVWNFPLYQSSIGYNSVCTAVVSTKIHPQAIADNTKSVKIVQNKLTNYTRGRQQKLLFCKLVKTRVKSLLSIVILVKMTSNTMRPSFSKLVKARVILLQSIVIFVETTSNVTRPSSATIKMGVLLSSGRPAPMSEPMFAPNTKEKMHSNGQQGIIKRVEEDKTRETSNNTNIVEVLRVVTWFSSKVKASIHMKGAYSPHLTSISLYERNIWRSSPHSKQFPAQVRKKYLDLSIERSHHDLKENSCVDLEQWNNCSNCHLTCIYKESKRKKIDILGIVQGGLSFPLHLILPVLPPYHSIANTLTGSTIESKSHKACDSLAIQYLFENQQQNHNKLMDVIIWVAPEFLMLLMDVIIWVAPKFHMLLLCFWNTDEAVDDIVTDSTRELFWHQYLSDNVVFLPN